MKTETRIMKIEALEKIEMELDHALEMHGEFHSLHEGYAVILEELEEYWEELKKKRPNRENLKTEMVQVGAMALKTLIFLEKCEVKALQIAKK